jgi:hypothetical protein
MIEGCVSVNTHRGVKERCLDTSSHGINSAYYLSLHVSVSVICVLCVGVLISTYMHTAYIHTHTYVHSYVSSIVHHMDMCPTTLSYGWLLFTHTHSESHYVLYCISLTTNRGVKRQNLYRRP